MTFAQHYDAVVIGCGIAGLSAATAAQTSGARVLVLERAPAEQRGGNSRYTGAYLRMKDTATVTDDFEEHFAANAGGYLDPALMRETLSDPEEWSDVLRAMSFVDPNVVATLAERAPDTLAWLEALGLRFFALEMPFPTSAQPRIVPSGGGAAMIDALADRFTAAGGDIVYEMTARGLVTDAEGCVCGVDAMGRGRRPERFSADAVVIASGGFQGNAEMLARYLGPRALYLRPMSAGCHYNKGEGIRMALDLGAAPCGDYGSWHASPMDPRSPLAGPSVYIYPYGILVNVHGERFTNEAPGPTDETYEGVTREIHGQPHGLAYTILDSRTEALPNESAAVRTDQPPIVADNLDALAQKLEIPAAVLERTVAAYNAACRPGAFEPLTLDGLATRGLVPAKSHWAQPIDSPPFRAYPIISSIVFTFGGLKVDTHARVLDTDGDVIPGLYAAGEAMGLYYGTYTGATSVLKGAVFGRIAGLDIAASAVSAASMTG